jgi:hypothetical protein
MGIMGYTPQEAQILKRHHETVDEFLDAFCECYVRQQLAAGKSPKELYRQAMKDYMEGYVKSYRKENPTGKIPPPPDDVLPPFLKKLRRLAGK